MNSRSHSLALAVLALAPSAFAQTTIEFEVYAMRRLESPGEDGVRFEPAWRAIPLTDEGRGQLAAIVASRFPEEERARSHTWRVFQRLREPEIRDAMMAAASVGGPTVVRVRMNPFDRRRSLLAGESIRIPDVARANSWVDYTVRSGDSFPRIAGRVLDGLIAHGRLAELDRETRRVAVERLVARILRENAPRFDAWPAVIDRASARQYIRFGEYAYRQRGQVRPTWKIDQTLVHEAGHLGDRSRCSDAGYYYGPDHSHSADEVITAQAALAEGWAHYQAVRVSDRLRGHLGRGLLERPMYYERHTQDLAPEQFRARHQVSNEYFVARLLMALEQASSRSAVEAAFRATARVDCSTVADVLAAFRRANAGLDLGPVLRVAFGSRDPEGLARLARGELPEGAHRTQLPSHVVELAPVEIVGDPQASEEPAAEAARPGVLGL